MELASWQIILLVIYAGVAIWDSLNPNIGLNFPVIAGFFAGLVLGDVPTGLAVGGTLQLMILGVGGFGGASVPDYMSGALVGTAFAVMSGQGIEFAVGVAVPIGMLLVQLDIVAKLTNTFLQQNAEKAANDGNYKKVELMNILGAVTLATSRALPVFLALFFGNEIVSNIIAITPDWLLGGLKVAGGLLPSLGIAILLKYLPIKNFYGYLIIGFLAAAYLKIPMLGVALLGGALAIITYTKRREEPTIAFAAASNNGGTIDEDE